MADVLAQYLSEAGRKPFVFGQLDCFLFVADWLLQQTGIDPAAPYRGTYATMREARSIMRPSGGAEGFTKRVMALAGCEVTTDPASGDVGLVKAGSRVWHGRVILAPFAAICVRPQLWAIKASGAEVVLGNFPVIRAWRPGACRKPSG